MYPASCKINSIQSKINTGRPSQKKCRQATWCQHYTLKVLNQLDLETDTGELCGVLGVLGVLVTRKYPSKLKQDLLIQHPQQYSKVLKNLQRRLAAQVFHQKAFVGSTNVADQISGFGDCFTVLVSSA